MPYGSFNFGFFTRHGLMRACYTESALGLSFYGWILKGICKGSSLMMSDLASYTSIDLFRARDSGCLVPHKHLIIAFGFNLSVYSFSILNKIDII